MMLSDGRLHLSGIERLAPHLTESNREELLARAARKSKRQIEVLVAELKPRPEVPTVVRKLPERRSPTPPTPPKPNAKLRPDGVRSQTARAAFRQPAKAVEPLAPSRYKIQFTAGAEMHEKLRRLQALTGSYDLATVIEEAVTEKLERLEARRFGKTEKPRKELDEAGVSPSSRYIPAAVKRAVYERDGDRCTFIDARGKRCTECNRLEFHHQTTFARGGDHSLDNICLMCRAHNGYLAERDYGKALMETDRRSSGRVSEPGPVYHLGPLIPRSPQVAWLGALS